MIEKTVLDMVTALAVIVNAEVGYLDLAAAYFYGASGNHLISDRQIFHWQLATNLTVDGLPCRVIPASDSDLPLADHRALVVGEIARTT